MVSGPTPGEIAQFEKVTGGKYTPPSSGAVIQKAPPVRLTAPKKTYKQKRETVIKQLTPYIGETASKVLTSAKTTAVLAATLATMGAASGAVAGAAATPTTALTPTAALSARVAPTLSRIGGGLLNLGKKAAVSAVSNPLGALKTTAGGIVAAGLISGLGFAGISKLTKTIYSKSKAGAEILTGEREVPGNLKDAWKTAGLIGAGAAAGAAVTKGIEWWTNRGTQPGGGSLQNPLMQMTPGSTPGDAIRSPPGQVRTAARRKRRVQKQQQPVRVSQRVNVVVSNIANKRYINNPMLMN